MTEPHPLRQRIARAIHRYDNHHALSGNDIPSKHHQGEADFVLAELRPELDALAALRAVARGYCPNCGRGDAAPTVADWEEQRDRAGRLEIANRALNTATLEAIERAERAETERDGAYRERAHLIAWLAAMTHGAVITPALDVDEPGWWIAYLPIGGHQASWHISPRDAGLFLHVERVEPDDPRAQWDGHTTEEKYAHIRRMAAPSGPGPEETDTTQPQPGPMPAIPEGHVRDGVCSACVARCQTDGITWWHVPTDADCGKADAYPRRPEPDDAGLSRADEDEAGDAYEQAAGRPEPGLYDHLIAMFGGPLPWPARAWCSCGLDTPLITIGEQGQHVHQGDPPEPVDTAHRYCSLCGGQVQPGHTCDPAVLKQRLGEAREYGAQAAKEGAEAVGRLSVARERLRLAREALVRDGYFTPEQVGDDIAPRIVEWLAHHRDRADDLASNNAALLRCAERAGVRRDQLAAILRETLDCITLGGGQPRDVADLDRWRAVLDQTQEPS